MVDRVMTWLDDRLGLTSIYNIVLDRKVPKVNWWYTLGSASLVLFLLQGLTGMFLAVYYVPSPADAYNSIEYIMNGVTFGWLVRGVHHWGASLMVVVVFMHMLRTFYYAAYKYPREVTWFTGVGLLLVTMAFGFTGYLLPWDQLSIWAVTVGSNMARATPLQGHEGPLASLLTLDGEPLVTAGSDVRFALLGGRFVGENALLRFYVLHCVVLPLAMVCLVGVHFWRVRKDGGIAVPPGPARRVPAWPHLLFREVLVLLLVMGHLRVLVSWPDRAGLRCGHERREALAPGDPIAKQARLLRFRFEANRVLEPPEQIVARVEEALRHFGPEQIFLNPDCGFGCFANRCVNEEEVAVAKLRSMVEAAERLRQPIDATTGLT